MARNGRNPRSGADKQKDDTTAMDVAMDTTEEIHLVAPMTLEQIGPQLDLALTELGININIEENLKKLREISTI